VTTSQRNQAAKDPGVKSIGPNAELTRASGNEEDSLDEATQIEDCADVDIAVDFSPAKQPPSQSSSPTGAPRAGPNIAEPAAERLSERDGDVYVPRAYAIVPRNGKDNTATSKTQQNLQQLLGDISPPMMIGGEVWYWAAYNGK
jgi:hypothetical protein